MPKTPACSSKRALIIPPFCQSWFSSLGSCYAFNAIVVRRVKGSASSPLFSNSLIYTKFAFSALPVSRRESRRVGEGASRPKENQRIRFASSCQVTSEEGKVNYRITRVARLKTDHWKKFGTVDFVVFNAPDNLATVYVRPFLSQKESKKFRIYRRCDNH